MNALLIEQLHHALSTSHAGIAQHFKHCLKGGPFIFKEIAQDMDFSATHICIDFDTWNKIYIKLTSRLCCFRKPARTIMVGESQHTQADIFSTMKQFRGRIDTIRGSRMSMQVNIIRHKLSFLFHKETKLALFALSRVIDGARLTHYAHLNLTRIVKT